MSVAVEKDRSRTFAGPVHIAVEHIDAALVEFRVEFDPGLGAAVETAELVAVDTAGIAKTHQAAGLSSFVSAAVWHWSVSSSVGASAGPWPDSCT